MRTRGALVAGSARRVAAGAPETVPPPSGEGTVVLHIGGDVGAAIVEFGPEMEGAEIEIRASGGRWTGTHTAVRPRHLGDSVRYAAVYGSLHHGRYQLRPCGSDSEEPVTELTVRGGSVTEAWWPSPR